MLNDKVLKERLYRVTEFLHDHSRQDGGAPCALIVSSAPAVMKTRDLFYPYRQDSDFFYLTASELPGALLIIYSTNRPPTLFAPPVEKAHVMWDGKPPSAKRLSERLGFELVSSRSLVQEAQEKLRGIYSLYYPALPGSLGFELANRFFSLRPHQRGTFPRRFLCNEEVLGMLRLIKDDSEIALIREAIAVSAKALDDIRRLIRPGITEQRIAREIELSFASNGARASFDTIVAGGSHAATLHHRPTSSRLERGTMLLLDWGAECSYYAADVTRVFPIGGTLSEAQAHLYDCVLAAQEAAIAAIRPGVPITKVYAAAARELARGMKDLRLLPATVARLPMKKLVQTGAFREHFPHSIGHSLGLDVHDVGSLRGVLPGSKQEAVLKAGMILTIEPGLYVARRKGALDACGIRIEDDVLVTKKGHEVLSSAIPKSREQVAALIGAV